MARVLKPSLLLTADAAHAAALAGLLEGAAVLRSCS